MVNKEELEKEVTYLRRQLEERNNQLAAVHRISARLSGTTDLDALLEETLEECLKSVHANAGSILLYDEEEDKLVFRHVIGEARDVLMGMRLEPNQGIAGEVFTTGKPKLSRDVSQDKRHLREIDDKTKYRTRNMVTVPLKSIEGEPIGVMQILNKEGGEFFDEHDIELLMILSAQAAAAIESQRLYEEAKLAVVVKLMGDISHDIKNMITPIQVCAQTLQMLFESYFAEMDELLSADGGGTEWKQRLQDASQFLREFYPEAVDMFLSGSKAVQDRVREIADCVKGIVSEPNFEMLNINDLVNNVVTPLRLVAEQNGIEINLDGLSEVPLAPIDQKRMYNAIYNLVNNAIPETPAGGKIFIRTAALEDGEFPEGNCLIIEVEDTGRGMPEEVRAKLFTKDAVSTKPGGTGLGTRIVKNAVDAHHGTITVESQLGVGSKFTLRLPLHREDVAANGF